MRYWRDLAPTAQSIMALVVLVAVIYVMAGTIQGTLDIGPVLVITFLAMATIWTAGRRT